MLIRLLVALVIISSLAVPPAFSQETEDSQVFIAGFNAYQQKDYTSSIEKMNEVLQKYPDTPLRDMALFWLSRSYYKAGNQQEAARYLTQFSKEYPDNPLKSTVEDELLSLAARYEKGEKLSAGASPVKQPDRLAAQKAKAEKDRAAAVKAEEAKQLAAAESLRLATLRQAEANAAAEKKELARVAAAKLDQDRIAAAKAEEARLASAATAAESARIAALKRDEEKAASEKAEKERVAAVNAEQERIAATRAEETKLANAAKAEQERLHAIKAEEDLRTKAAAAESALAAAQKTGQEREAKQLAAAESARLAAQLERDRTAAAKAEAERLAAIATAAESARIAGIKQAEEKAASERAEKERLAAVNAEQERIAGVKAEEVKLAAAEAESNRLALLKAEEERTTAERTVREAASTRLAEEVRATEKKQAEDKAKDIKLAYREKAIAQYKSIIDTFPASTAAITAAVKLRELGVVVALPPKASEAPLPENAQVLQLEVAQFAGVEFNLLTYPEAFTVGRQILVPFEIINRGNGVDSFYLDSAFPADFKARFAPVATPGIAINQTPELAPGEAFNGVVTLTIPAGSIDGLRITHPIKAASRLIAEASQSREVRMVASAPLLRAVLRTEKTKPLPGDKVAYRIAILNVGSTVAQNVTFRLNFPPQLEPVDYTASGFRQEMNSVLVFDGLQVNSGESREFSVLFQLKEDSLAGQELSTRAELINNPLNTKAAFVSNMAYVEPQRSISVRTGSARMVSIPGQTISVPFVVTNSGNIREKFKITSIVTGAQDAVIFNDLNRDGIRQASEPVIYDIGPLAPREEASVVVEIKTPVSSVDGSQGSVQVTFVSEGDSTSSASGSTQLTYSRPVLKMAMTGRDGLLKPGDVASFDLTITNNGSNLARVVELQSAWPEQLELVAADPATNAVSNGNITWRFKEMGAGEKRNIKVSFRVKPGIGVGTAIQVKNILSYEDQLGNRY